MKNDFAKSLKELLLYEVSTWIIYYVIIKTNALGVWQVKVTTYYSINYFVVKRAFFWFKNKRLVFAASDE